MENPIVLYSHIRAPVIYERSIWAIICIQQNLFIFTRGITAQITYSDLSVCVKNSTSYTNYTYIDFIGCAISLNVVIQVVVNDIYLFGHHKLIVVGISCVLMPMLISALLNNHWQQSMCVHY